MARGRSSSSQGQSAVTFDNARSDPLAELLGPPAPLSTPVLDIGSPVLTESEDRRLFDFDYGEFAKDVGGMAANVVVDQVKQRVNKAVFGIPGVRPVWKAKQLGRAAVAFRDPRRVAVCLRRHARRQVLHALKLHRKIGSGRGKRRRTTWMTAISCKG